MVSCKKSTTTPPIPSNQEEAKILGQWNIVSVNHINIDMGNKTEEVITGQSGEFFWFDAGNGKKVGANITQPNLIRLLEIPNLPGYYFYEIFRVDDLNSDVIKLVDPVTNREKKYYTVKKLTATDLTLYVRNEYSPGNNSDEITITFTKKI